MKRSRVTSCHDAYAKYWTLGRTLNLAASSIIYVSLYIVSQGEVSWKLSLTLHYSFLDHRLKGSSQITKPYRAQKIWQLKPSRYSPSKRKLCLIRIEGRVFVLVIVLLVEALSLGEVDLHFMSMTARESGSLVSTILCLSTKVKNLVIRQSSFVDDFLQSHYLCAWRCNGIVKRSKVFISNITFYVLISRTVQQIYVISK